MTFKQFYEQYITKAFGYAMSFLRDSCEAEEVVSDCFVRLYGKWDMLKANHDRECYLFSIVKNLSLNRLRDLKVARERMEGYDPGPYWEVPGQTEEHELIHAMLMKKIRRMIGGMPKNQRRVIQLFLRNLTDKEIANRCHCTEKTVRNFRSLAYEAMRKSFIISKRRGQFPAIG